MISGTSLISKIPQNSNAMTSVNAIYQEKPIVAAVSVADVVNDEPQIVVKQNKNFINDIISKMIDKYTQKRIERLENTPIDELTANEKAELEANRKANVSISYMS